MTRKEFMQKYSCHNTQELYAELQQVINRLEAGPTMSRPAYLADNLLALRLIQRYMYIMSDWPKAPYPGGPP